MNFNGSGGLMFLVIAGLWLWVFVPTWFKRSQERATQKNQSKVKRSYAQGPKVNRGATTIAAMAELNHRLRLTRRIFNLLALFSISVAIGSIFASVSQIFYLFVTSAFFAIFIASIAISRAATRKLNVVLSRAASARSTMFDAIAKSYRGEERTGLFGENPVNTRDWEPSPLPAPKQRIGELEQPTLAEVVGIEELVSQKSQNSFDPTALDEILRRRRANG